jgi:hypothetical protein
MCFNCRLRLDCADGAKVPLQAAQYVFTPAEIVRLERYRAAIQAGLYTG